MYSTLVVPNNVHCLPRLIILTKGHKLKSSLYKKAVTSGIAQSQLTIILNHNDVLQNYHLSIFILIIIALHIYTKQFVQYFR